MSINVRLERLPSYIEVVWRSSTSRSWTPLPGSSHHFDFQRGRWRRDSRRWFADSVFPETIVRLKNCYVNSHGVVLSPEGEHLASRNLGFAPKKQLPDRISTGARLDGEFVFGLNQEPHFGHWLLQRLPRIHSVLRRFPQTRVITSDAKWDPRDMLAAVGAGSDDTQFLPHADRSAFFQVESLVMANHAAPHGSPKSLDGRRFTRMARSVRTWATEHATIGRVNKLYLSRDSSSGFREGCRNRAEIEAAMSERGFTVVLPERLPFADQVSLVSRAEHVCSETGSASILSLFSEKLKTFTVFSPVGEAEWSKVIALYLGANFRLAELSGAPRASWVADTQRLDEVLSRF